MVDFHTCALLPRCNVVTVFRSIDSLICSFKILALQPTALLGGIGGVVLLVHHNDERRAVLKGVLYFFYIILYYSFNRVVLLLDRLLWMELESFFVLILADSLG